MNNSQLQVAFDGTSRSDLQRSIEEAVAGGADVIEIGTPLLKRYGVSILDDARRHVPAPLTLYADVKMLDFPDLELKPALDTGADEITVLAFASDQALGDALSLAADFDAALSVSTMGYPPWMLVSRIEAIRNLGIARFVAHGCGTDLRQAAKDAIYRGRAIRRVDGTYLLIGGGLRGSDLNEIAPLLPATIIVGRSLTRQARLEDAVAAMRAALSGLAGSTDGSS